MNLGVPELLIILALILIFFGAEKIPQLARSLGKGMAEFRKAQQEFKEEIMKEPEAPTASSPSDPATGAADSPYVKICPACKAKTVADAVFCTQCGERMPSPPVCGNCRRVFLPDEKFCPNCGQTRPQA